MKSKSAHHLPASATAQPRRILAALLVPLVAAFFPAAAAYAQTITSAVPGFFTYQGKVTNANGTLVGAGTPVNRTVVFRIWSHQSNSTVNDLVYSEQQTVTISEGEFSVLIGQGSAVSGTPLGYSEASKGPPSTTVASAAVFGGATRFLGLTIDDPSTSADPEVSPRQQLVTSAYAFRAKYAESVGANGVNSLTALDNGNVGIGTSNPAARLEVNGSIRAGGAGMPNAALSLLANSASTVASTIGFANSAGNFSTDSAAGDTVFRTDNGGKLLLQSGTGAAALTIGTDNKVGIFTSNPTSMLQVGAGANTAQPGLLIHHGWFNAADTTEARPFEVRYRTETTPRFAINTDGNVGVGVNAPGKAGTAWARAKLAVDGNIMLRGEAGGNNWADQRLLFGGDGTGHRLSIASVSNVGTLNNTVMALLDSGIVGIGTTTPATTLDVRAANPSITVGTASGTGGGLYFGNSAHGALRDGSNNVRLYTTAGAVLISANGQQNDHLMVASNGAVAIGTTNTGLAKFTVWGTNGSESVGLHHWFSNTAGLTQTSSHHATDISIRASGSINASQYRALSDARIKRIAGRSNGAADLALLNQIEITDYTYIDTVTNGGVQSKKLIGQQVEKVFPQAVRHGADVLPDIYKRATSKDGWVELATDLKAGERVRLIADKTDKVYEVLEVHADRFRTSYTGNSDKLFVYGREVKDFRTVDYEAVAMLGVSATQELSRQNDALRAANEKLEQRVAELEAKDRARDARFAAIEKLLSAAQTVMARPAAATSGNASGQE